MNEYRPERSGSDRIFQIFGFRAGNIIWVFIFFGLDLVWVLSGSDSGILDKIKRTKISKYLLVIVWVPVRISDII